jgi:spore coat protein U-like protein
VIGLRFAGVRVMSRPCRRLALRIVIAFAGLSYGIDAAAAADCTVSATGVNFGAYDPSAVAPSDSTGNVVVLCTHVSGGATKVKYTVSLSTGSSGTYAARQLRAGTKRLTYNLFGDSGRSAVWGNGFGGTTVMSGSFTVGPGAGNHQRQATNPIYGRIPAGQSVLDGAYSDTIVVTLEF